MSKSIGIIGCGAVTQNNYAKALAMYHDVKVEYVCDLDKDLADKVAGIFSATSVDLDTLIAKADIIIIATPPSSHFSLIKQALKPGKIVVCEKPFVPTLEESEILVSLAKEVDAKLYVAHFRRCFPSAIMARSIILTGILGNVTSIEAYEGGKFSWATTSGYVYKDPFGGVLFDTGSHTIDLALFVSGYDAVPVTPEIVQVTKDKDEPAHDVYARLQFRQQDASTIDFTLRLSRRTLLSNKVRVNCQHGYIDVSAGMTNYVRIGGDKGSEVVYANYQYDDILDCFALQFKDMFAGVTGSSFDAEKFRTLTSVLEIISKQKI